MKKYRRFFYNFWLIVPCLLLLYFLIAHPAGGRFSETENRKLAPFPQVSLKSIFSGTFENGIENYLLDAFICRDKVIGVTNKAKDAMSIASYEEFMAISEGNTDDPLDTDDVDVDIDSTMEELNKETVEHKEAANLDDFPLTVGCYIEKSGSKETLLEYSRDRALAVTAVLNRYAALLPENGKVVFTMVPQSIRGNRFVGAASGDKYYSTYDEIINAFGADNVFAVDTPEILGNAMIAGDYCYFRTDMHWTPYGTYLVYKEMMKLVYKDPLDYNADFDITVENPFLGTYYRDYPSENMKNNADSLDVLMPKCSFEFRRVTGKDTYNVIDFLNRNARANDRYTVYLGGPGSWAYTEASNGEEENALVITDSFGLGFVPLVVGNYHQVHYYDPRYYDKSVVGYSVAEVIEKYDITDVYVVVGDLHCFDSGFIITTASGQLGDQ